MSPISEQGGRKAGAAAAVADLARAGMQEEGPKLDPQQRNAAYEIFRTAEKFLRAVRTYESDHPSLLGFLEELEERITEYTNRYEELLVGLHPTTLTLDNEIVYAADRVTENMWFPLFGDGIRQLSFSSDGTRDDLIRFFKIVAMLGDLKDKDDLGEDDSVTLLWEADLTGVSFVAVSHLMEGREENNPSLATIKQMINLSMMKELTGAALTGGAYASGEVSKRMHTISLSEADLIFLRSENLGALDEMPMTTREVAGKLFDIDEKAIEEFVARCGAEPRLVDRYLIAVLGGLGHVMLPRDAVVVVARLRMFLEAVVNDGRFRRAARLLAEASETIGRRLAEDLDPRLAEALQEPLVTDEAARKIVVALAEARDPDLVHDLFALVAAVPLDSTPEVVKLLYRIPSRDLRRQVCDLLAPAGLVVLETASAVIDNWEQEEALDLLYLMQKVGKEPGLKALEKVNTSHPEPRVRTAALLAYLEAADPQKAAGRARRMLSDDDPLLRRSGVEYLVSARVVGAHEWIKSRLEVEEFAGLDFAEKKRLYIAYATLGGKRTAKWLTERLTQRNLFAKSAVDHERAAAALALARLHVDEARPALERILSAKLTRGVVKEACVEALKLLDAPAARHAPAARPRSPDAPPIRPLRRPEPQSTQAGVVGTPAHRPLMPAEAERDAANQRPPAVAEPAPHKPTVQGHAPTPPGAMPMITFRSTPAPAPASDPPRASSAPSDAIIRDRPPATERPAAGSPGAQASISLDLPPDEPMELLSTSQAEAVPRGGATLPRGAPPTEQMPAAAKPTQQMPAAAKPTQQMPAAAKPTQRMPAAAEPTQQMPAAAKPGELRFNLPRTGALPIDLPPIPGTAFGKPLPAQPAPPAAPARPTVPPRSTARPTSPRSPDADADRSPALNDLLRSYMDEQKKNDE